LTEVDLTDAEVSPQVLAKARSVSKVERADSAPYDVVPSAAATREGPLPSAQTPTYQRPGDKPNASARPGERPAAPNPPPARPEGQSGPLP
jgi:hypothetical protein